MKTIELIMLVVVLTWRRRTGLGALNVTVLVFLWSIWTPFFSKTGECWSFERMQTIEAMAGWVALVLN